MCSVFKMLCTDMVRFLKAFFDKNGSIRTQICTDQVRFLCTDVVRFLHNTDKNFNRAINFGLKEIGAILGIEDLEFYAARHSWATIALNKCGIDKYTVHSALNHVDDAMKVTDIYIERDFVIENQANVKVLKYVFG